MCLRRRLYGKGIYLADASSKSHQYARGKNAAGHHCMLACRVTMGDPHMTPGPLLGQRRPPSKPGSGGLPHDSVFAQTAPVRQSIVLCRRILQGGPIRKANQCGRRVLRAVLPCDDGLATQGSRKPRVRAIAVRQTIRRRQEHHSTQSLRRQAFHKRPQDTEHKRTTILWCFGTTKSKSTQSTSYGTLQGDELIDAGVPEFAI